MQEKLEKFNCFVILSNGSLTKLLTCSSFNSPAGGYRVIVLPLIIGVEKPFEPLEEFKVILETSFHQFVDWNNLKTRSMIYKWLYVPILISLILWNFILFFTNWKNSKLSWKRLFTNLLTLQSKKEGFLFSNFISKFYKWTEYF